MQPELTYANLSHASRAAADARYRAALTRLHAETQEARLIADLIAEGTPVAAAERKAKADPDLSAVRVEAVEAAHTRDLAEAEERALYAAVRIAYGNGHAPAPMSSAETEAA